MGDELSTTGFPNTRGWVKGLMTSESESLDSVPLLVEASIIWIAAMWSIMPLPRSDCMTGLCFDCAPAGIPLAIVLPSGQDILATPPPLQYLSDLYSCPGLEDIWLRINGSVTDLLQRFGVFCARGRWEPGEYRQYSWLSSSPVLTLQSCPFSET